MRFVFLGTGTSAGIPAIGCDCAVCTSKDPRDQRLRSGAAINYTDPSGRPRTVLIDASPDLRQQCLRFGITRCDAILFTHNHVDHTFGLDEVRRFNALQKAPIDIYGDEHTLEHLRRVYRHIFDAHKNVNQSFVASLIPNRVEPFRPIDLHGLRFTPIPLLHGRLPVLGYRIEQSPSELPQGRTTEDTRTPDSIARGWDDEMGSSSAAPFPAPVRPGALASLLPFPLAYCTDLSAIPNETWPHLRGLRTLVLDCLRHRHHPTHLTVDEAVRLASDIGADHTYFVHMAHDLRHSETESQLPDNIRLAYDGLTL